MASFQLLSVLGNGSGEIATHYRFSLAAYQSGSTLVLWDYIRSGGASRKLVQLQANQRCSSLFFSKDASCLLGFWLSQGSQPMMSVWRVADGTKISEHRLSDCCGCRTILADYHLETSNFVVAYPGVAASASVVYWDHRALKPHFIAHGHIGASDDLLGVRLLDGGQHFVSASASEIKFWAFVEQHPRLVLKVDFSKPMKAFAASGQLVYLVPQSGRVRLMNLEGGLEPAFVAPPPGPESSIPFTAIAVRSAFLCLGSANGVLRIYKQSRLELWKQVPAPYECAASAVAYVAFGMNEDYVSVVFRNSTYGIVHLESCRYVSLRVGHSTSVRSITMAPHLRLPPALAGRLLDPERVVLARTIAFISLASDANWLTWPRRGAPSRCHLQCVAKPPTPLDDQGLALEVYVPRSQPDECSIKEPLAVITAAAFHPDACLSNAGRLPGAYRMLVGTQDGSLHILASDDGDEEGNGAAHVAQHASNAGVHDRVTWRPYEDGGVVRVRPPTPDLVSSVLGDQAASCCHISFSRCGRFAAASFNNGFAEVVNFPLLTRVVVLQNLDGWAPGLQPPPIDRMLDASFTQSLYAKTEFVWHPIEDTRIYDKNEYVLSHTLDPREAVLYEVYMIGDRYAKTSHASFVLPTGMSSSTLGTSNSLADCITDFCAHPSQMYLVMGAVLPALESRSVILVFNLWTGELLKLCSVFNSLLVTPLAPLRPRVSIDASGAYLICASTPMMVGSLDQNMLHPAHLFGQAGRGTRGSGIVTDSVIGMPGAERNGVPFPDSCSYSALGTQTASVVCIIDFCTGHSIYQSTVDMSCATFGSLAHDPTQLLFGSHDGTISVWSPPDAVSNGIRQVLEGSRHEYMVLQACEGRTVESMTIADLEAAVATYWARVVSTRIDWETWGEDMHAPVDGHTDLGYLARPVHGEVDPRSQYFRSSMDFQQKGKPTESGDDIVVHARQGWLPSQASTTAHGLPPVGNLPAARHTGLDWEHGPIRKGRETSKPLLEVNPTRPHASQNPYSSEQPELRPEASKSLREQGLALETVNGDAQLVVSAPELQEEFGTLPEHTEDPLVGVPLLDGNANPPSAVPRWLEKHRPKNAQRPRASPPVDKLVESRMRLAEERNFQVVESVFDEIDEFERNKLAAKGQNGLPPDNAESSDDELRDT